MKVYSWKTLLITIFSGGIGLLYALVLYHREDWSGAVLAILSIIVLVKGIRTSMTRKGMQQSKENEEKRKRAYQTLFGRFSVVMPYGGLIAFFIAFLLFRIFPHHIWLGMCFVVAAPVYQLWFINVVQTEIDRMDKETSNS